MAKKILAIFFVSILLCSYIIPTTSAFADVVIGDNDSIVVTQQGLENGKKIATMEAILQLLESGVSEINFNDVSDLDDYLEDLYDELTNVNYQDVSNEMLAGAYNDVKSLKQWIDDRGEYIATYYKDMLNSADEGLSDIFNRFQLKLQKGTLSSVPLNGVRGLNRFSGGTPQPSPDVNYLSYLYTINSMSGSGNDFFWRDTTFSKAFCRVSTSGSYRNSRSGQGIIYNSFQTNNMWYIEPLTINITSVDNVYQFYVNYTKQYFYYNNWSNGYKEYVTEFKINNSSLTAVSSGVHEVGWEWNSTSSDSSSGSLSDVLSYIANHYRNVNIYVDNIPWAIVFDDNTSSPTLDIDGFLKMYGNDNPVEYNFPRDIQIDYNALYTTIYNAIRDNLPLDMQTINNNQVYYDSHDTVYSPTIYNYYGKDGDDENDWIDSILDYATIPDFNAVLGTVAVLDAPFVNGITIVNAGVTDVIPTDILVILGGFFVLVLFVCIINRMSE